MIIAKVLITIAALFIELLLLVLFMQIDIFGNNRTMPWQQIAALVFFVFIDIGIWFI